MLPISAVTWGWFGKISNSNHIAAGNVATVTFAEVFHGILKAHYEVSALYSLHPTAGQANGSL